MNEIEDERKKLTPVAWKADNGQWAATEKDAIAYEQRMNKKMYPLCKIEEAERINRRKEDE